MLRVPLEDLLLQALAMVPLSPSQKRKKNSNQTNPPNPKKKNIHDVGGFLERAIDVSNKVALRNALDLLLHLSAIEKITPPSSASASSASPSPSPSPSPASSSSPSSSPSPQSSSSQTQNRPRQRAKYALTPLGVHLARLPLHPRLGKMMVCDQKKGGVGREFCIYLILGLTTNKQTNKTNRFMLICLVVWILF